MLRFLAATLVFTSITSPAIAQTPAGRVSAPVGRNAEVSPEKLLSPTSQLYIRWDGIAAHSDAYKKSFWGGVMAGPTGGSIRSLLAEWPKLLGKSILAEPLLEGKPPEELKRTMTDLKNAAKIVDLIADKGVVIAAEVREPKLTLKALGQSLQMYFRGEPQDISFVTPEVQVFAVVPDVREQAEVFFSALNMIVVDKSKIEPFAIEGRKGFQLKADEDKSSSISMAWWVEGKHFVLYIGTTNLETTLKGVVANINKGGITGHALYQQCAKNPGYESVTRGYVDTGRLISMVKTLAGPLVPVLGQRIDDLGISNLKSIMFNSGFEGKESRATYEFDLPGERKGFAKILKQQPLGLKDLPPLPPDVNRFSALRVDPAAAYDAAITTIEALRIETTFELDEDATSPADEIRLRRERLMKEADKLLGVNIRNNLLPHLSDKFVIFNSPSEGLSSLGTVICLSVKDPAKIKTVGDRIHRALEEVVGAPVKVRKKQLCGVEIRELYSPGFYFFTPTYAIVDGWLVIAIHPQPVQGFVMRAKGELPVWKPDAATTTRLAKLPADGCGLQYCDPRSTVQNLCCIGPLFFNVLSYFLNQSSNDESSSYNPIDIGLVPNAHELNKHLFPNLTVTRDDGRKVRIEVNESFSLPLEIIGLEAFVVGSGFLGALGGF